MAVAHDAVSESHTGTAGVANVTSFNWNHAGGASARSALVFTHAVGANPVTGVTYGGVAMTAIPYTAYDSDTEPGFVQAWFLDGCGTGTKQVVVNRTSNAVVTYAVCMTQTAASDKACEVYLAGVKTQAAAGSVQTAASSSGTGVSASWTGLGAIGDGSPGSNSVRYMAVHSGAASVSAAGTSTTSLGTGASIDYGNYVFSTYRDTTPSQGNVTLAIATAISDDLAAIGLAIREKNLMTGTSAATWKFSEAATGEQTIPAVTGTSAATWKAQPQAYGVQAAAGTYPAAVLADAPRAYWRLGEKAWTPDFACGFEDAAVTTHWSEGGTGPHALDTTVAGLIGAKALRIDYGNDTTLKLVSNTWTARAVSVARFRFRLSALPSASTTRLFKFNGVSVYDPYIYIDASDSRLYFSNGGTNATGPVIAANTWYTVAVAVDGANQLGRWSVDGVAQPDPGAAGSTTTNNGIYLGKTGAVASGAFSVYFEDVAYSGNWSDYPVADGYVNTSDAWVGTADNLAGNPVLDGVYTGTPTMGATGAITGDTAVNFDASGDYVQLTDNPLLEPGTAYTWEAWVKRNSISDNTCFYSKETGGQFYGMANGNLRIGNNNGTVATSTSTALSDTNWHHVVVTYAGTGAGNTLIYIDGAEGHTDGAQISVGFAANAANPRIGDASYGGEPALAIIDEVAVYQSVLSAARIAAHYAAGRPATGTAASTWKFSESATGEQASVDATGTAASTFKFSPAATGTEVISGTSAATFKYSVATTGTETITGTSATTFKASPAATGTETLTGTAASTWKYSIATTGAEVFTGTSAASWKYSEAASGWTAKGYAAVVWADAPVGYWRLGEANGTTAVDEMGNGNGTYVNSPTLGDTGALDGDANTAVTFGAP